MTKELSEQQLHQLLLAAREQVEVGGVYGHYKGNRYEVVDVAILTEEIGVGVIYRALYGKNIMFVRPLEVWLEEVKYEGRTVERFSRV